MKELDLGMVRIAQKNSAQAKRMQIEDTSVKNDIDIQKICKEINQERLEIIKKNFYQNSIQDSKGSKRKRVYGRHYVKQGDNIKEKIKIFVTLAVALLTISGVIHATNMATVLEQYNKVLDDKMEAELTSPQIAAYEQDHRNAILSAINTYGQIQDAKKELKETGNYNIMGTNINNPDDVHRNDFDPTDLDIDAINKVVDETMEEYEGKFYYGR